MAMLRQLTNVFRKTPTPVIAAVRNLHLHEGYSLELLKNFGVTTPRFSLANTAEEASSAAKQLGDAVAVKAQVLAGGRGKGHFENGFQGGVHVVPQAEVAEIAKNMIGHKLITKQTGASGRPCNMVVVMEKMNVIHEYYFAILMDRAAQGPMLIASSQGGMDIEAVAKENPSAILKEPIDITKGLTIEQASSLAARLGFAPQSAAQAAKEFVKLYKFFVKYDCTMVEINPFVQDAFGNAVVLDAKVNYDDNSLVRQPDVISRRDFSQENALDVIALQHDINYIGLDGSIGCLVNGAGLAMATMDIIQLHGGKPANFLDIGGGATVTQVTEAFKIITADTHVNCILVNIFGGIMRCDTIAEGIIHAAKSLDLQVPVIVRLQGTRRMEAKALIAKSGLDILSCDDLDGAARKAVQCSKIAQLAREANVRVSFKDITLAPQAQVEELIPTL